MPALLALFLLAADVLAGDESLVDAARESSPTRLRVCLNGPWRSLPVLSRGERTGSPPASDGRWTTDRLPSVWPAEWRTRNSWDVRWYRRTFEMPREAAGRRCLLSFDLVSTRVEVFVDGHRAGEAVFPGGTVDLSDLVKPGVRQTIDLKVSGWPFDRTTLTFNAPNRAEKTPAEVRFRGITGDVWLDLVPRGARLSGCWTETSVVRREITFKAELAGETNGAWRLEAEASGCGPRKTFRSPPLQAKDGVLSFTSPWADARLWDLDTPANIYEARVTLYRCGASGERIEDVSLPFRFGFREVSIKGRDIYLNGTRIHLRALLNQSMNRSATAAGREAAAETIRRGRDLGFNFVISGHYDTRPGSFLFMDGVLDACDRAGVLYSLTMPHVGEFGLGHFRKGDNAVRYRALARALMMRTRNHPSVISYAINHNCVGYQGDANPLRMDGTYDPFAHLDKTNRVEKSWYRIVGTDAANILKDLDPTRLVYHHESGSLGEFFTSNTYLNWAPIQERSDWLEDWARRGAKPMFFVEWGCPHIANWSSHRGPTFIWTHSARQLVLGQECAAAFRGDAAYDASPAAQASLKAEDRRWSKPDPWRYSSVADELRAWEGNYQGIQRRYLEDNWRCLRAWGISAVLPWDESDMFRRIRPGTERTNDVASADAKRSDFIPTSLCPDRNYFLDCGARSDFGITGYGRAMKRWNGVDCAFIGGGDVFTEKRHHYRPGESVRKTLVILNDRRRVQDVGWSWQARDAGGNVLARAKGVVSVAVGGRADVPVSFAASSAGGRLKLEASFVFAGGARQTDAFDLDVLPPAPCSLKATPSLFDPLGETAANLERLGIQVRRTSTLDDIRSDGLLLVGRGALENAASGAAFSNMVVRISSAGGRILVFEQTAEALERLGFRTVTWGTRQVFPRAKAGGLGLTADGLRDWAGEATLVPPYLEGLEKAEIWPPKVTWQGFVVQHGWRCRNRGSVASVLLEKPSVGNWKSLADCAFDLQYTPLAEVRAGTGAVIWCQLDVTGRTVADPAADDLVRRLLTYLETPPLGEAAALRTIGAKAEGAIRAVGYLPSGEKPRGDGRSVYVVSDGEKMPQGLMDEVRSGADVLCLGFSADDVMRWSPIPLAVAETNGCVYTRIERIAMELDGLSNADWAWHGTMDFAAFQDKTPDGNVALRIVPAGKGRIVFWQTPPWFFDLKRQPQLRHSMRHAHVLLARILGNLGAGSSVTLPRYVDGVQIEDDPYRYFRW